MSTNPKIDLASAEELELDIIQDDIDQGVPAEPAECAIARAFRRLGGQAVVQASHVVVDFGGTLITFRNPSETRNFIRHFDFRCSCAKPTRLTFFRANGVPR